MIARQRRRTAFGCHVQQTLLTVQTVRDRPARAEKSLLLQAQQGALIGLQEFTPGPGNGQKGEGQYRQLMA